MASGLLSTEFVRLAFLALRPLHTPESLSAEMNPFVSQRCRQMTCFWGDSLTGDDRRWILVMLSEGSFLPGWATGTVTLACWVWAHCSTSRPKWGYFTLSWTSKPSYGSSFDVFAQLTMSPCFWILTGRAHLWRPVSPFWNHLIFIDSHSSLTLNAFVCGILSSILLLSAQ